MIEKILQRREMEIWVVGDDEDAGGDWWLMGFLEGEVRGRWCGRGDDDDGA